MSDPKCMFGPCVDSAWRGPYCRTHNAQRTAGRELSDRKLSKTMWLMEIADGYDPGRDGHGCIQWPYNVNWGGYGLASRIIDGKQTQTSASRWLCEMVHGAPPDDGQEWFAAHNCGRGKQGCVTPRHLEWKTREQNEADKVTHDSITHGERNPNASLTANDVRKILLDPRTAGQIAIDYGTARVNVSRIKRGVSWRRVFDAVVAEGHAIPVHPTGGRRGTANQNATLSTAQIRTIRASNETTAVLADRYSAHAGTVSAIRRGHSRRFE